MAPYNKPASQSEDDILEQQAEEPIVGDVEEWYERIRSAKREGIPDNISQDDDRFWRHKLYLKGTFVVPEDEEDEEEDEDEEQEQEGNDAVEDLPLACSHLQSPKLIKLKSGEFVYACPQGDAPGKASCGYWEPKVKAKLRLAQCVGIPLSTVLFNSLETPDFEVPLENFIKATRINPTKLKQLRREKRKKMLADRKGKMPARKEGKENRRPSSPVKATASLAGTSAGQNTRSVSGDGQVLDGQKNVRFDQRALKSALKNRAEQSTSQPSAAKSAPAPPAMPAKTASKDNDKDGASGSRSSAASASSQTNKPKPAVPFKPAVPAIPHPPVQSVKPSTLPAIPVPRSSQPRTSTDPSVKSGPSRFPTFIPPTFKTPTVASTSSAASTSGKRSFDQTGLPQREVPLSKKRDQTRQTGKGDSESDEVTEVTMIPMRQSQGKTERASSQLKKEVEATRHGQKPKRQKKEDNGDAGYENGDQVRDEGTGKQKGRDKEAPETGSGEEEEASNFEDGTEDPTDDDSTDEESQASQDIKDEETFEEFKLDARTSLTALCSC